MSVEERVKALTEELHNLGPMLPGTISRQYNVCGKPGCRCKDPIDPQRHGPYYQLSFTIAGRSSTVLVKPEDVDAIGQMTERWKRYKELGRKLGEACIELARGRGVAAAADIAEEISQRVRARDVHNNVEARAQRMLQENRDHWKAHAMERTAKITAMKTTIRDLQRSRDSWKEKASQAKSQLATMAHALRKSQAPQTTDSKKNRH